MRPTDARTTSRLHAAVALFAAVWMLTITADSALPLSQTATPHHPHAVAMSDDGDLALLADHPHIGNGSSPAPRDIFTAVLPPRTGTALIALGLIAALAAAGALFARIVLPATRGPPRLHSALLTGQQLTTRLCIARR